MPPFYGLHPDRAPREIVTQSPPRHKGQTTWGRITHNILNQLLGYALLAAAILQNGKQA